MRDSNYLESDWRSGTWIIRVPGVHSACIVGITPSGKASVGSFKSSDFLRGGPLPCPNGDIVSVEFGWEEVCDQGVGRRW